MGTYGRTVGNLSEANMHGEIRCHKKGITDINGGNVYGKQIGRIPVSAVHRSAPYVGLFA